MGTIGSRQGHFWKENPKDHFWKRRARSIYAKRSTHQIHMPVYGSDSVLHLRLDCPIAQFLAREFAPRFAAEDFVSLPRFHAYVRLMIDGETSKPFSATTIRSFEDIERETKRSAA